MSDGEFSDDAAQDTESSYEPASYEPSEPTYREPPQSWQRDVAERHWNALPDDLRGYLHNREKEAGGKISELGRRASELESVSTRYQSINSVFQRYQPYVPQGLQPEHAIESLLHAQRMLSEPETRQHAIGQLLETYGVNPVDLLPAQYRQHFETTQRELQSAKQAEVQRTLDEFVRDKAYYPEIRDAVIQEIVELRKGAPGLDHATILRLAHDRVVDRTGIKSRLEAEAQAKQFEETQRREGIRAKAERAEMSKRVKAARRAGSINVKSTPVRAAPKTMDDELRAIAHRVYGR